MAEVAERSLRLCTENGGGSAVQRNNNEQLSLGVSLERRSREQNAPRGVTYFKQVVFC
jgi:hypothetical protein